MEIVTPQMFGAGLTSDDSKAIQAANDTGKTVFFPSGEYRAANLIMSSKWMMSPDAKIIYIGKTEGECVRCVASGLTENSINIDCDGREPRSLLFISGNDNHFSSITIENVVSKNHGWVVRSLYIDGKNNLFDKISLKDLINNGNNNNSSPQGIVLSKNSNNNIFKIVSGNNTRSVVVENSSGHNKFHEIRAKNCKDNAFYAVGYGCHSKIDQIFYDGDDNVAGFRHGANASIGMVHIFRSGSTGIFFGDCGNISIRKIFVHDTNTPILHLNYADTGIINIGTIKGSLTNTSLIFMPSNLGNVEYLSIEEIDLTLSIDENSSFSTNSLIRLDSCMGINITKCKIDIILKNFIPKSNFFVKFNPNMDRDSNIGYIRLGLFLSDGLTPYRGNITALAIDVIQSKMRLREGLLDPDNHVRPYTSSSWQPHKLVAASAPTKGYWRKGDKIWNETPISRCQGWICMTSGSPGSWKIF